MKRLLFIILLFINYINAQEEEANRIITFFIEEYPRLKKTLIDNDQALELCNIINCKNLNLSTNFGIFSTYAGYLTLSDENGQITFPRKTVKESINLLITPKIYPIFMFQNTIAYWEVPENTPASMYRIEKQQDKDTGIFYWNVSERKLSSKRQVPLHTIVIFSNPDSIYVPTGITISTNNPQLVLPTIYAKKDQQYAQNALFILTIKPFFSKINKLFKERPLGYEMHIT